MYSVMFHYVFCVRNLVSYLYFVFLRGGSISREFVGEPVSDVRPYLAPVDELIEANYKRTEGGRRGEG